MAVVMDERLLTVPEVAAYFRVKEETVRRWLRTGRLRGMLPGGDRGGWRVPEEEVRRLREELLRGERPGD